jgi:acetylornithine deacetylase
VDRRGVAPGDAVGLLRALVSIDSRNPRLVPDAPGEGACASMLADVLRDWGFGVELQEAAAGRPNVIARVGGDGGPVLMFNGHIDVVGVEAMVHAPFDAAERDGQLYGRGASDMKGGVAAMCAAAARAAKSGLAGSIVVAAVVDEEFESAGTRTLVESGVRADFAVVTEPTGLAIAPAHKGFTWTEVVVRGRAAHGSRFDLGVDAIRHAAHFLTELDRYEQDVLSARTHPLLGRASLHASTIGGGVGWSTYPESCVVRVERRTLPGERTEDTVREIRDACDRVQQRVAGFDASVSHVLTQLPSDVAMDAPAVTSLRAALETERETVAVRGVSAWTDAALLNAAGIPAVCFGPGDMGLAHAAEEFISLDEVERATRVLTRLALDWCGAK